jgi:hypothetical protein
MPRYFFFLFMLVSAGLWAQDTIAPPDTMTIHPHSITYLTRTLMANQLYVHTKDDDSLIVVFNDGQMFSMSSMRPDLTHLTDTKKRVRYSMVNSKQTFKVEKVIPDTTGYVYTYVKLKDTIMIGKYVGYRRKFTMKDKFTGTTYTVVLYECPDIKIDPEYSRYFFAELFFMKVPIKVEGGIIKALAEQRINNKPVSRDELILRRFDDDAHWPVDFKTPIEKGYTMMMPDGSPKEKKYAKELLEELSGRKDYPTVPYREEFDHN